MRKCDVCKMWNIDRVAEFRSTWDNGKKVNLCGTDGAKWTREKTALDATWEVRARLEFPDGAEGERTLTVAADGPERARLIAVNMLRDRAEAVHARRLGPVADLDKGRVQRIPELANYREPVVWEHGDGAALFLTGQDVRVPVRIVGQWTRDLFVSSPVVHVVCEATQTTGGARHGRLYVAALDGVGGSRDLFARNAFTDYRRSRGARYHLHDVSRLPVVGTVGVRRIENNF